MGRRGPSQLELPLAPGPRVVSAPGHTLIDGRTIDYVVRRSRRRRSISLTIDESGLRVGAPWTAAQRDIESMLRRHARWIARKLEEWNDRRPAPRHWRTGETIVVLGAPLTLALAPQACAPRVDNATLTVGTAAMAPREIESAVMAWLKQRAVEHYTQRAAHYAAELGVGAPDIRLSAARTRWGSCHANGRVRINWRLIQCPPHLVDYVIVHELAHLRHMNHSSRFWNAVGGVLADYAERRAELRRDSARYLVL